MCWSISSKHSLVVADLQESLLETSFIVIGFLATIKLPAALTLLQLSKRARIQLCDKFSSEAASDTIEPTRNMIIIKIDVFTEAFH